MRPASEFSVVDEMPDSVKALADRPAARAPRHSSRRSAAPRRITARPRARKRRRCPRSCSPSWRRWWTQPPKDADDWLYEIKFDGYRMLARAEGGASRLITRNGNDWTRKLPELAKALRRWICPTAGTTARSSCRASGCRRTSRRCRAPSTASRTADIVYYLFDLPYCAGHDLREVPLVERREVLQRIVERKPHDKVRFSAVFDARPQDMLASACRLGLEGVIGKRRGLGLRRPALGRLGQAQVRPAPGVRDRRLHRSEGFAHRHRLAAAGRARRRGPAAVCGQRGHGLQRADPARAARAAGCDSAPTPARSRANAELAAQGATGSSPSWSARWLSANGPATAASAIRSFTACAPTSRPRRSLARSRRACTAGRQAGQGAATRPQRRPPRSRRPCPPRCASAIPTG